jgi:geranylgeranyl pyrophosphate synthase
MMTEADTFMQETGGLFRLLVRLMAAESPQSGQDTLERLCRLLGRYFQIRDDYQNLGSEEVGLFGMPRTVN